MQGRIIYHIPLEGIKFFLSQHPFRRQYQSACRLDTIIIIIAFIKPFFVFSIRRRCNLKPVILYLELPHIIIIIIKQITFCLVTTRMLYLQTVASSRIYILPIGEVAVKGQMTFLSVFQVISIFFYPYTIHRIHSRSHRFDKQRRFFHLLIIATRT